MTTPQQTPRLAADPSGVGPPDAAACPACPHLLAAHDAIGTRFGFALSITVWSFAAMMHAFSGSAGASPSSVRVRAGVGNRSSR